MTAGIRDNKGLSLIELIVVVMIIAIMSTGAVVGMSVIYDADAERAAKNLYDVIAQARTNAMAYNYETSDASKKVEVLAIIEKRKNGDNYGIVKKVTGGTDEEVILEKRLSNYRVDLFFGKKGGTKDTATELLYNEAADTPGQRIYRFKRGTGRPDPANADSEYNTIYIEGAESFKIILSSASGKCYFVQ